MDRRSVRYLGVHIHTDAEVILRENYGRAISKLEDDIAIWKTLPLSLIGRGSIMKMVILPRFLFLFVNIPIVLPRSFFHRLKQALTLLAWAGKQARVHWNILTLPYTWAD